MRKPLKTRFPGRSVQCRLTAGILAGLMLPAPAPVLAAEETAPSGTFHSIGWVLEDHVLTLTGSGCIPSGADPLLLPNGTEDPAWKPYAEEIRTIVVSTGITGADTHALAGFPNLEHIILPSTFTTLAPFALQNNSLLTKIDGLEYVTDFNFNCLSGTGYIAEHPYIITDGRLYYAECTGSTKLTVPDGVTEIMPFAFGNLTGKEFLRTETSNLDALPVTVILPDSVEIIHDSAFAFCAGITDITVPENLRSIGDYAFFDCAHLHDLILTEHVKHIGEKAFFNCRSLDTLTVTAFDAEIGADAYGTCYDWEAAIESRRSTAGDSYEHVLRELVLHPCRMDEEMADFAVHFFGTEPYSRIAHKELTELTNKRGTLAGWQNSTAQSFAVENSVRFETLNALPGDVDLNGFIDILDVIALNKSLLGIIKLKERARDAADYDADGSITDADSLGILRCILGIPESE